MRSRLFTPRLATVVILLLLAGLPACGEPDAGDPDPPPPPPQDLEAATSTYALLVGCTLYPELQKTLPPDTYEDTIRLEGPTGDVELMGSVLRDYMGVPADHIQVLAGWPDDPAARPTRANIVAHLERLAREVPRGGRVFFLFAGHGCQAPDDDGDELDRREEVLMPADTGVWDPERRRITNTIADDEIRDRLGAIRAAGATVWAVFDCCHSGTMLRDPPPAEDGLGSPPTQVRDRFVDPAVLGVPDGGEEPPLRSAAGGDDDAPRDGYLRGSASLDGIAAIYAAHSWERASEMALPRSAPAARRAPHGLCTFELARTLQRYGPNLTLREIHRHVKRAYELLPWTRATPMVEGDQDMTAVPRGALGATQLILRRTGDTLWLEAGALRDLTVGTVLEVFRPGGFGDASARLGRLVLTEVEAARSACGPVDGEALVPAAVPDGAPARVVELAPGRPQFALGWVGSPAGPATPAALERVRREALPGKEAEARFPFVPAEQADWFLTQLAGPDGGDWTLALWEATGTRGFSTIELPAGDLRATLERIARARTIRRLAARSAPLPEGVTVEAFVRRRTDTKDDAGTWEPLEGDLALAPADVIELRIVNGSQAELDVVVEHLDAWHREDRLWPAGGPSHRLTRAQRSAVDEKWAVAGGPEGRESILVFVGIREQGDAPLEVERVRVGATPGAVGAEAEHEAERRLESDLVRGLGGMRGLDEAPPTRVAVREFTFLNAWGRLAVPSEGLVGNGALEPPLEVAFGTAGPDRPLTHTSTFRWARFVPGRAHPDGGPPDADALLLGGTAADGGATFMLLIDTDDDARLASVAPAEAARAAAAGRLPVDLAVRFGADGVAAAYPRHAGDAHLGRVVEASPDGTHARRLHVLGEGAWASRPCMGPWLWTGRIPAADNWRADGALRRFLRPR